MPSAEPVSPATLSEQLLRPKPAAPAPSINITINIASATTVIFQQTPSPGGSKSDAPQL